MYSRYEGNFAHPMSPINNGEKLWVQVGNLHCRNVGRVGGYIRPGTLVQAGCIRALK